MVCKNIILRIDGRGGKGSYECQLALLYHVSLDLRRINKSVNMIKKKKVEGEKY